MLSFWILLGLLTCAATALVVWPLLHRRNTAPATATDDDANRLAVYRDRRREIERERDAGRMTAAEAEHAIEDLVAEAARLLPGATDLHSESPPPAPARRSALPWAVVSGLAVPLIAIAIYAVIGSPAIVGADPAMLRGELTEQRIDQAVQELSELVERTPEDGEAWAMLAQALRLQDQPTRAAEAYAKAIPLLPPNARLLADYAETLVLVGHGNFAGRPTELLAEALRIDPNDGKAVALMGAAQYRSGNLDEAIRYLAQLARQLPEGSPEANRLAETITRIESERGAAPGSQGQGPGPGPGPGQQGTPAPTAPASAAAAPTEQVISGTVAIDDALRAKIQPGAVLYIVARAAEGSRVPLAVLRLPADRWPVEFTLGEAQAMDPKHSIAQAGAVIVEARVSASGDAMRRPGDPIGSTAALAPGSRDVTVHIDRQVP